MIRSVRFWAAVILVAVLVVCLIYRAHRQTHSSQDIPPAVSAVVTTASAVSSAAAATTTTTINITTTTASAENVPQTEAAASAPTEEDVTEWTNSGSEPYLSLQKYQDMQDRTAQLSEGYPDFVGWLYLADSDIDYAVVQGSDNQYFLSHAPNGKEYECGSIFLDYRCDRHFSDSTNILFGHNMSSGMFGDLRRWRSQEEFDAHRYGWFMTPDTLYMIDFFVMSVTSGYDAVYTVPCEADEWRSRLLENALFTREMAFSPDDRYLLLTTCAADFNAARLQYTGRLVPMTGSSDYLR
ncbi:MAG: class B sortase [Ruminococcus sp.]|nr:class B sortase [Ruminococcus sp.]